MVLSLSTAINGVYRSDHAPHEPHSYFHSLLASSIFCSYLFTTTRRLMLSMNCQHLPFSFPLSWSTWPLSWSIWQTLSWNNDITWLYCSSDNSPSWCYLHLFQHRSKNKQSVIFPIPLGLVKIPDLISVPTSWPGLPICIHCKFTRPTPPIKPFGGVYIPHL